MRHYDLSPLYRSTVGFDRLFSILDQAAGVDAAPTYPPYNIERTSENEYRITVAVAGFGDKDIAIESKENTLTIRGEKSDERASKERGAAPGHRRPCFRAPLPARRLRPGDGCEPRERPAPRRPRARDPGGQEAPADPGNGRRRRPGGSQEGCLSKSALVVKKRPHHADGGRSGKPERLFRACWRSRRSPWTISEPRRSPHEYVWRIEGLGKDFRAPAVRRA